METIASRRKRRRISTRIVHEPLDPSEEKLLKLALAKSKVEISRPKTQRLPSAAVFYPTEDEFRDPITYISRIAKEGAKTGICKIVPPKGWQPDVAVDLNDDTKKFGTRVQRIHQLQEGKYYDEGREHTFRSYRENADVFRKEWYEKMRWDPEKVTSDMIEQEYWRIVETGQEKVQVEYANDLDTTALGSGFEMPAPMSELFADEPLDLKSRFKGKNMRDKSYYKTCGWNLNNLPQWPGSLLRHIRSPINGVNVPWLYCGMMFATFCWHTEDNYLYSINYMHHGAKKRWYGVPSTHATLFEKVMKSNVPLRFSEDPDLLFHLVTMISPSTLTQNKVHTYTLLQEPGDIILTFPQAYHSGYSEGFNCNEAVNFALPDWLEFGRDCTERYRHFGRLSVFSQDRLLWTLIQKIEEQQYASCKYLLDELRGVIEQERTERQHLRAADICNVIEMPRNAMLINEAALAADDRRQCRGCKHTCYFSGVICACSSSDIYCLRHMNPACKCPSSSKYILIWSPESELKEMLAAVNSRLEDLKANPSISPKSDKCAPSEKKKLSDPNPVEVISLL